MSVSLRLSNEATEDGESMVAVFGKFVGCTVDVSTPERTASGDIIEVGWSEEHQAFGFTIGEIGNDTLPTEFVPFNYTQMEVVYA